MLDLSINEAQLFRQLAVLFGQERVIPHLSVLMVCGGELPNFADSALGESGQKALENGWASKNRCLFTIVDHNDQPKLVIDIMPEFSQQVVDVEQELRARVIDALLQIKGIHYVPISDQDCQELFDPASSLDLVSLLQAHLD